MAYQQHVWEKMLGFVLCVSHHSERLMPPWPPSKGQGTQIREAVGLLCSDPRWVSHFRIQLSKGLESKEVLRNCENHG